MRTAGRDQNRRKAEEKEKEGNESAQNRRKGKKTLCNTAIEEKVTEIEQLPEANDRKGKKEA